MSAQAAVHPRVYDRNEVRTSKLVFAVMAAFFAFEFIRPQDLVGALGPLRLPMLLNLMMLSLWLFKGRWQGLNERLVQLFFLFMLACSVTIFFAQISESVYLKVKILFILMFTGVLPMIAFLSRPEPLLKFFRVWAFLHLCLAAIVLAKGGVGPGSFLSDENDVALALGMGLPFVSSLAISPRVRSKRERLVYRGGFLLIIAAIVITESRGGFVGLAAVLFVLWLRGKNRGRKLIMGFAAAIVLAGPLAYMLPEGYIDEITSITDTSEDTAYERLRSWKYGVQMFLDHPLLGVGAGNYLWEAGHYSKADNEQLPEGQRATLYARTAHSAFVTILSETGAIGSILYLMIIIGIVKTYKRSSKVLEETGSDSDEVAELLLFGRALEASLVGFLTAGAFLTVAFYPNLWWLIGLVIALERSANRVAGVPAGPRRTVRARA